MNRTKIKVYKDLVKGEIDSRLYGSFVEHMGRVVYSGIYEKNHLTADEDGFRGDVIEKTKEMGVTVVRYPGGNFVSNYNWMDGIGPRHLRPIKRELAWKSIETNEIGIDEFMLWAKKVGVTPVMAVNLGSKGLEEAISLLEYCNSEEGTYYSNLRVENGNEEPYGIKTWCLGNEMDGDWQIGHKTAQEYGRLAYETGKAMKVLDPTIELVVCGSSLSSSATFIDWEQTVLNHTYDVADYISLHQYYGGQEKGTEVFLAQSLDMERYIETVCHICDVEKVKRKSKKQMQICFDEWGVWTTKYSNVQKSNEIDPWKIAPAFGEQIYSMEDALLFSSMLMALLKNADRVKIGCQSLLTNISACIMTEPEGEVWLQTIYYPFQMIAQHGKGVVLQSQFQGPTYKTEEFDNVPYVDYVVVWNVEDHELVLFMVNRSEKVAEIEIVANDFMLQNMIESKALFAESKAADNRDNHETVLPKEQANVQIKGNCIITNMCPLSFQMIRISIK